MDASFSVRPALSVPDTGGSDEQLLFVECGQKLVPSKQKGIIMKRLRMLILIIALAAGLAGCGVQPPQNEAPSPTEDFSEVQGYYLHTDNGNDVVIDSAGTPIILSNQSGDGTLFDGLTNGDMIAVTVDGIAETYPAEAGCYSCVKQQDGELQVIPDDVLQELKEFGLIRESQPAAITVIGLTQQQAEEYEAQGIPLLGDGDSTYSSYFLVSFDRTVTELSLWRIEMDVIVNDTFRCSETECIGSVQDLAAGDPVVLAGDIGELLPTLGISFVTDDGVTAHDYLTVSGKDGSPMLVAYEVADTEQPHLSD